MPTDSYDPFDPAFQADPYPAYGWLRDHDPVHHRPADDRAPSFWALSRFEDVWHAVRTPQVFSSASGLTFFHDEIGQLGLPPTIVMLDPPVQTRLRALIGRGFTPRRVARLEVKIRDFVRSRITAMERATVEGRPVDLQTDFSTAVPTWVLAELLGLPESDRERFGPWVQTLTRLQNDGFDSGALMAGSGTDPNARAGVHVVGEMFEYFTAAIASSRADPGDDLLGALVTAEIEGETLSDWDILGFCFVVVAGGADTTAGLISHTVLLTGNDPAQRELLVGDLSLIPDALTECLRLESSVQGLARTTLEEVVVHGVPIPAGEKVMMLYAAANRDPREYGGTVDQLDVRRQSSRHLAFGSGPHFCIGNHLARLQARVAVEELLAAHPRITVDPEAGVRHESAFVRGWVSLPAHGVQKGGQ